jgi:hypothetical protein
MNDRAFFMFKQNAMNKVMIRAAIWIVTYIIQWLIEKRREHINQNRNAVTNAVAKN